MRKTMIIIEPLSKRTLSGALKVLDKIFGKNPGDKMQYNRGFHTSLGDTQFLHLYPRGKPSYLQYFVALDMKKKKVIGTTGLYAYPEDDTESVFWLGWYCVDPDYREQGIGTALLDFSIQKAIEMKKKILRLWTSTDSDEIKAQKMYERRGFKIFKRERQKETRNEKIYMELNLSDRLNFKLEPLSAKTLKEASSLAISIFDTSSKDVDYPPKWFKASIEQEKNKSLFESLSINYLQYYVVLDSKQKVIGLTGLYSTKKDESEAYWLGWFFVDPKYRGKGLGTFLINSMISKTRNASKQYLRLYTSPNEAEKEAQEFYERRGFRVINKKKVGNYTRVYREIKL